MNLPEFKFNKIEKIILTKLSKKEFVSGNEFYKNISKKLDEYETVAQNDICRELERLTQEGKIVRYELQLPNHSETKRKADKFPRYYYKLFK